MRSPQLRHRLPPSSGPAAKPIALDAAGKPLLFAAGGGVPAVGARNSRAPCPSAQLGPWPATRLRTNARLCRVDACAGGASCPPPSCPPPSCPPPSCPPPSCPPPSCPPPSCPPPSWCTTRFRAARPDPLPENGLAVWALEKALAVENNPFPFGLLRRAPPPPTCPHSILRPAPARVRLAAEAITNKPPPPPPRPQPAARVHGCARAPARGAAGGGPQPAAALRGTAAEETPRQAPGRRCCVPQPKPCRSANLAAVP
jgi:hypothetical protein